MVAQVLCASNRSHGPLVSKGENDVQVEKKLLEIIHMASGMPIGASSEKGLSDYI